MKRRTLGTWILLLSVSLACAMVALSSAWAQGSEATNQFLFLTLHLKDGVVTLKKAEVVSGRLKPQTDSTEANPLLISLEQAAGETRWNLAINDPSVQRLEYEDPQQPGALKVKMVPVNDVEFVVRAPMIKGVRFVAIHRKDPAAQPAAPGSTPPARKLVARIELPGAVTR